MAILKEEFSTDPMGRWRKLPLFDRSARVARQGTPSESSICVSISQVGNRNLTSWNQTSCTVVVAELVTGILSE